MHLVVTLPIADLALGNNPRKRVNAIIRQYEENKKRRKDDLPYIRPGQFLQ